MLSVDDTSFVKKGTHCIGVKRQYCGSLGKRENCQVGVFLSYAGDSGYGLVDYDLYIPEEWFQDLYQDLRTRCRLRDTSVSLQRTGLPRASSTTRMGPDGSWHNWSDVTLRMDVTTPSCIQRIVCYHIRRNHRAYCLPTNFYPAPELLKMRIPDSICRIHKNV